MAASATRDETENCFPLARLRDVDTDCPEYNIRPLPLRAICIRSENSGAELGRMPPILKPGCHRRAKSRATMLGQKQL